MCSSIFDFHVTEEVWAFPMRRRPAVHLTRDFSSARPRFKVAEPIPPLLPACVEAARPLLLRHSLSLVVWRENRVRTRVRLTTTYRSITCT